MSENDVNKTALVRFEPAGWRTIGEVKASKSMEEAYDAAVRGTNTFLDQNGVTAGQGIVLWLTAEVGYQSVSVVMPERLVAALAEQPFVGREYPDQIKSTLQVMSLT